MNNLVIMKNQQAVTSSLQVAETFGKQHKDVLEAIKAKINTAENSALLNQMFSKGTYKASNGKTNPMYYMNRDGFSFIVMGFTGHKADSFKLEYISAFNQLEKAVKEQSKDSYMIEDPVARAKKWIEEQRELQRLHDENTIMQPKALFADAVATAHTTILVGELAKLIKQNGVEIGPQRLFKWLRANGYLIKRKGSDWNMPTQKSMSMKLFKVKEGSVQNPDGSVRITKTPKVTGKGQQYFINKFLTDFPDGESM